MSDRHAVLPSAVRIVLASNNEGKLAELRRLLPADVFVESAREAGVVLPDETETTFAGNALLKARAAVDQTRLIALADDSGLEIDALGGAPGVRSARYAGEPSDDAANNELVRQCLAAVPVDERTARFRSAVAVVLPDGREHVSEGVVEGTILETPRGTGGFGYDPLFQPVGYSRSMAELSIDEKNRISHRGKALLAASRWLLPILEEIERDDRSAGVRDGRANNEIGDQHE